ncbi:phage tail protein [Achromobacter xylosoxidans]|uniref:phage tail protein n=1 Tax=Alcaligenes xylosoxydans xylosoxydans TaxID=85698 RepID=UPI002A75A1DE|nr:phage tail protein [Achromobacter xylosoxidans]WPQ33713.1 phage tail protein [Achromobacter xylosoxidans]
MEQLEQIPIGQQPNDGTGDPLRNGMAKVNANFTKVQTGVDSVELTAANAAQTATEAKTTADAAIPAAQKGMAGGVAPLDASGKVPAAHLPELADYIPVEEKGAAGGVAPLDALGKVPADNLPAAEDSIPLTQKGAAGGVATLDSGSQVPAAQLGNAVKATEKAAAGGVATLDAGGKVPAAQLPPIPTGPPAGSVAWWPLRSSIPAGQIPADGQTISRATFPDLAAMVLAGTVPVVSEADWQADPLKRGSYTLGDGSTTIRVPDLNGKSAGAVGAVFLRGDGSRSAGTNGLLQPDVVGPHTHTTPMFAGAGQAPTWSSGGGASATYTVTNANGIGPETRPLNVTGAWTVQAFGAVTNPGSADAAQLASDYAALNAAFQTLRGQVFGPGQTLQDMTASRAFGTNYVNSTGKPIFIFVYSESTTAQGYNSIFVNSQIVAMGTFPAAQASNVSQAMVPPGATYMATGASTTLRKWQEYR